MSAYVVRALSPSDADATRGLVMDLHGGGRHELRMRELLESAFAGIEDHGLVVMDSEDGGAIGVALYGAVAGASGVMRVHLLMAVREPALAALAAALLSKLMSQRIRIAVAEVADDGSFAAMLGALQAVGFQEESRVADWFADGVGLRILAARAIFKELR